MKNDTSDRYLAARMFAVVLLCTGIFAGCDSGPPEFSGTATWNGQSIETGYIEFSPLDGNGQIVGATISDGNFSMRCSPGMKKVSVRASRQVGMKPANERMPAEPIIHQYLPDEFNSRTSLTKELNTSAPQISLELKGEELKYTSMAMPKGRKDNY